MSYPPVPPPPAGAGVPAGWGPPPPNSGKAVAALVLGILGVMSCQPLGVAAIVVGNQAAEEIAASGGQLGGEGMAKVGVVLGWVAVASLALIVIGLLFFFVVLAAAG